MNKYRILSLLIVIALFSSCSSKKTYIYLSDMESGRGYVQQQKPQAIIRTNDCISIIVSSKTPELAIPFNVNNKGIKVTNDGDVRLEAKGQSTNDNGYVVDINGNIDFPILGLIHIEGLTLNEASNLIKSKIEEGKYISAPTVTTEFINFRFYVLGAVNNKGEHNIARSRVSLLEAISIAGDLSSNARADRVMVIRENSGSQIKYVHDLTSKDIFESPGFYLMQNDIVYVEPIPQTSRERTRENFSFITTIISSITAVISVIFLARKL